MGGETKVHPHITWNPSVVIFEFKVKPGRMLYWDLEAIRKSIYGDRAEIAAIQQGAGELSSNTKLERAELTRKLELLIAQEAMEAKDEKAKTSTLNSHMKELSLHSPNSDSEKLLAAAGVIANDQAKKI